MAMRVRGFLYKNGSCLSGNDGLSFQADRVERVMLTDDMTLAQLKESIRGEVGGGDGLPDERLAPFYDQIDMEAQVGLEFPEDVPHTMDNPLFLGAMFDNKDALRQAVKMYSIRQHRDYTVFKSKATFVDYRCKWYFVNQSTTIDAQLRGGKIFSEKVTNDLERLTDLASGLRVRQYDVQRTVFEIEEPYVSLGDQQGRTCKVILSDGYCDCGVFQAKHYPCQHVLAACAFVNTSIAPYVDRVYHQHGLPPPCIVPYLIQAGFYGISRVGHFEYVRPLIRALVERWRPETHTFHFPQGECTITLQDVALQLGLPCSGFVVTRTEKHNYRELCMELLGIELPQQRQTRKGQRVSMSWLKFHFQYVPDHNSPEVYKQRYTRQYILHLLGGYLILEKTSTDCCLMYLPLLRDFAECGQYSWGSAVLCTLYRELCKAANPETEEIAGCLSLFHVWAWDRFPKLAPPRPPPRDPLAHIYQPLPPLSAM
ncbi:serine/threonine-protein phosphatase 7 long form-like protein [Senna tora]|uniref:Serine/threonine-protein phosphatase 7 long form-like protein n=1 Tax=Senna tora TaxID=362788 RepID=A0A834X0A6_9FABA|nr:serine/threonine-protein phosphatase 7 long form-like protein [Senna tora]